MRRTLAWRPVVDDLPILNPPECPDCFVCGAGNPEGLGLIIRRDGTDAVAASRRGRRTWATPTASTAA